MNDVTVPIQTTDANSEPVMVDMDLIISVLVPMRCYLLFRYFSFYSSWADDRAEKICNECNAKGGVTFAIKAELKERPYKAVGLLMLISILIFGYGLRNIEAAFMKNSEISKFQDWTYIWNGFWCIIITILTVGYGDLFPQTHLGRAIAVVACLWGTFLISLMVVSMTNSVDFTPQEEKAYDEIKKEKMYFSLKQKGLLLIREIYNLKVLIDEMETEEEVYKNSKEHKMMLQLYINKFKKSLNDFRRFRKFIISKEHENSTETILNKLNQCVSDDMEELINVSNHHVINLIEHVKLAKSFQDQINGYVSQIEKLTVGLHKCIKES